MAYGSTDGTPEKMRAEALAFFGNMNTNDPKGVKVSIDTLSKDVKTQSDNIQQMFNSMQGLKQDVADIKNNVGDVQAKYQRVVDRLDDLASAQKGVTPGIHHIYTTKALYEGDLDIVPTGSKILTNLPYKKTYLARYGKGQTSHITSTITNTDIRFEDEGGKLALTPLVPTLGRIGIGPGTP